MLRDALRWREGACLAVAALAILGLQAWGFHGARHDDAFITYRYGQNLAEGRGLVFNPGERVMGSTSPGQALLSAVLYPVAGRERFPDLMAIVGCIGWTAQAVAVFILLRGVTGRTGALLVAAAIAAGAAGSPWWIALETNLVAACGLWALCLARAERWVGAAALAGLAVLVRPDALLLVSLLVLPGLRHAPPRAIRRSSLMFLAWIVPWVAFATFYFGSPIPQSAMRKVGASTVGDYGWYLLSGLPENLLPSAPPPALILGAWLLFVAGTIVLVVRDRSLWILPAWGVLHAVAYLAMHPYKHPWHLYPSNLVFGAVALAAPAALAGSGKRWIRCGAIVFLVAIAAHQTWRNVHFARTHEQEYWMGARDAAYRAAGVFLGTHAVPTDRIATSEIGTVAYYTNLKVHDLGGLVTPNPDDWPPDVRWLLLPEHQASAVDTLTPMASFHPGSFTAVLFALDGPQSPPADR